MPTAQPDSPSKTDASTSSRGLGSRQRWQAAWITAAAIALFVIVRNLPVGSGLNHMDFRVSGPNVIPFCDPANPAFIPVVTVRSPVELRVSSATPHAAGARQELRLQLTTAGGKPIGDADLLESHTRKLHLLLIDPSLRDYQHLHPEPSSDGVSWRTEFTPKFGGAYRVFADFTPSATGRGLYAFSDLVVTGAAAVAEEKGVDTVSVPRLQTEQAGHRFSFTLKPAVVRAGERAELELAIDPLETGAVVPLEPVMGAFAHVVAFDEARSGFAHLHPLAADPLAPPDAHRPRLAFSIEIPQSGNFVLWAQVKLRGVEHFVPFRLHVAP